MNEDLLSGKKYARTHLGSVLILGLGTSGKAVANYCLDLLGSRIDTLTIAAGEPNDDAHSFAAYAQERGARVAFEVYTFEEHYDLCIASPGISQFSRFYENAQAASREVVSEVEFAWRESNTQSRWLAITGTNGKTTTTRLTLHILQTAGRQAQAVGNIGNTCIDAVRDNVCDIFVTEVSSFQLASTSHFAPNAAALLNITPDHLYWHNTFDAYVQAKKKIFEQINTTSGLLVIDGTSEISQTIINEIQHEEICAYMPIGSTAGIRELNMDASNSYAAYLNAEACDMLTIVYKGVSYELVRADELHIQGDHNIFNALAASALCISHGVNIEHIRRALRTFKPLEHRLEPCGEIDGITCFNDSKATNVDATLKAFEAFQTKPIFLLGGHDKGTDLTSLVQAAQNSSSAVVCFGAAASRFADAFSQGSLPYASADTMEHALVTALELAHTYDATEVVLSPACASFDEFTSFEHRGNVFKHLVKFFAQSKQG
ncbi:MAG: UDP-N-acetylmuramoyl-L-alanine--D-glutamate ligase [Eggerthellaceae bacterium]|nr:UDP-N-acetylmuramoyl-L-alanine--D-glutamate ligase [Eggerthellaceae bacterium]